MSPTLRRFTALLASMVLTACATVSEDEPGSAEIERMLQATSPFQRELIADGEVTFAEYEQATLANVSCLRDLGLDVSEIQRTQDPPRLVYVYRAPDGLRLGARAAEADRCYDTFLSEVSTLWTVAHQPSAEEQRRRRGQAIACLREEGVDVPDDATDQELIELALGAPAADRCTRLLPGVEVLEIQPPAFPDD